eukprot:scaffold28572_cov78-Skeletonema_dohrnii-CCMP3373.AAC.1
MVAEAAMLLAAYCTHLCIWCIVAASGGASPTTHCHLPSNEVKAKKAASPQQKWRVRPPTCLRSVSHFRG